MDEKLRSTIRDPNATSQQLGDSLREFLQAVHDRAAAKRKDRVFDQVFVAKDGQLRYDFEVYGTGKSVSEWNAEHPGDEI